MIEILPLSALPEALETCIAWAGREWGTVAGFAPEDWKAEFQRIEDSPVDQVFVALNGGIPVGMVWLLEHEALDSHLHFSPWLSSLVVDPAHRRQGIARALAQHVEAYASLGADETLYLLTERPGFYFPLGWEVADTAVLGAKNVFVMQKMLALPAPDGQD